MFSSSAFRQSQISELPASDGLARDNRRCQRFSDRPRLLSGERAPSQHREAIAAVAVAALSIGSEASASQPSTHQVDTLKQMAVAPDLDAIAARRRSPGILRRLLELERRKNAWLRRTFLNG